MKIEKEKTTKIIKVILSKCIYIIIIAFMMYNIIFSLNKTITGNNYLKILGISFFNMENELMKDDINKNDLVIVKQIEEKDVQKEDIVAYTINDGVRINKIINMQQQQYVTKSNKNYHPDIEKISFNQIIGKYICKISFLGILIKVLHSKITTIFIFIFLLLRFGYNKYVYTKKKERARKKILKW